MEDKKLYVRINGELKKRINDENFVVVIAEDFGIGSQTAAGIANTVAHNKVINQSRYYVKVRVISLRSNKNIEFI